MSLFDLFNFDGKNEFKKSVEAAIRLDDRLFEICMYEVSKGMRNNDFKNPKGMLKKIEEGLNLFNFYKKRIKDGEFSLNDLDEMIASKYGLVSDSYKFLPCNEETIDSIDEIVNELIIAEKEEKKYIYDKLKQDNNINSENNILTTDIIPDGNIINDQDFIVGTKIVSNEDLMHEELMELKEKVKRLEKKINE